MKSPLARLAVLGLCCSTKAVGALHTWVSVRENVMGPADATDCVKIEFEVSDNNVSAGKGFFLADLLGKVNEIENLVDYSLIGNQVARPPLVRGSTESSVNIYIKVSVSNFMHSKNTACPGRKRGCTPSPKRATRTFSSRRCEARGSGGRRLLERAPAPWLRGAAIDLRAPVARVMQ